MITLEIHLQTASPNQYNVIHKIFYFENFNIAFLDEPIITDPCNPSPCGANTNCNDGICTCLNDYQGDPYIGCRPECVYSTDCPKTKTCIKSKCLDPCPGTCGQNAICNVVNHIPMCHCPPGFSGNAFITCRSTPRKYYN